jgi:hypothetical protein
VAIFAHDEPAHHIVDRAHDVTPVEIRNKASYGHFRPPAFIAIRMTLYSSRSRRWEPPPGNEQLLAGCKGRGRAGATLHRTQRWFSVRFGILGASQC